MGLSLLGLKNMDTETMVIERFDTAIFFMVLTQHKLHTSSHSRKHSDTRGGAMVILQNRRKLKIHLFNHPLGYTEK